MLSEYGQQLQRERTVCGAAMARHKEWVAKRGHWKPSPKALNPFSQTEASLAERQLSNMRVAVLAGR